MNVLELVRQLLASDDMYAEVLIGEGTGFADTVTRTANGFVLVEPLPPVMAETLAAHQRYDPDAPAPGAELTEEEVDGYLGELPALPQREPGAALDQLEHRTTYPALSPEALADATPLRTLAADPDEDTP